MPTRPRSSSLRHLLARKIRLLRIARGWSQETLAEIAGLHRNYVSAVERARISIGLDNLERIARAFDMRVHELLDTDTPVSCAWPRIEERQGAYLH